MRKAMRGWGILAAMLVIATGVHATVIMDQDFEQDGAHFSVGVTNWTGAGSATTEGLWGSFDAETTISSNYAHSGTQSMVVTRDNNTAAGQFTAMTIDQFVVSYWLYRDTANSSTIILLQDGSQDLNLGLLVRTDTGRLDTYIGSTWVDSGSTIAVGTWTRVRMDVDLSVGTFGEYDLYLTVGDGAESLVSTVTLANAADQVDRVVFIPQGTTGNTVYVDDVTVGPPPELVVTLGSVGQGQDVINWTTIPNYLYSIYYSTDLRNDFLPLQTNMADTVQSWTNSINASPVFYQVTETVVILPPAPTVVLNQDFELDGAHFSAGVTGWTGAGSATTEGRWGSFDVGSTISTAYAHGESQSMVVTRDSNTAAGIFTAVTADRFEVSYWLYRDTVNSSTTILLQDGSQDLNLGLLVRTDTGRLDTYIGSGWVDTGSTIAVGTWTRIRMDVDLSVGTYGAYDLYLTVGNGAEALLTTVALGGVADQVDRIVFIPQSPSGNTTYVDDMLVTLTP